MSNTYLIGERLVTPSEVADLRSLHARAFSLREQLEQLAERSCEILGIDPAGCSLAKDFAEEIVLTGTPVEEAIRNIQAYQEAGQ
jgi:hypothetical protein